MDIKSVLIIFAFTVVTARTTCKSYEQVNKENIRNCFDAEIANNKTNQNASTFSNDYTNFANNLVFKITNDTLSISFKRDDNEGRKMKKSTSQLIQYALIPAFFMSGIMPWIIPKLQMAVMMVSMMNNMVFSSAVFSLVRNFVFEKQPNEHVVYVNNGYKNNMPSNYRRTGLS